MLLKHSGFSHPSLLADKAEVPSTGALVPVTTALGLGTPIPLPHGWASQPAESSPGPLCGRPASLTNTWNSDHLHSSDRNICNYTAIPGETSPRVTNSEHSHRISPIRMRVPQKGPQPKFTERRPLEMALPVAQGHCH